MACFNRASPALMEVLLNFHNDEIPWDIDHHLVEFGSVKYHIQATTLDPRNLYLSVSIPPLSPEVMLSNGLPNCILQDIKRVYSDIVEVVRPSKEGFMVTIKLDFNKLPRHKDECIKALKDVSSLQSVILCSQFKDMLWNIGSQDISRGLHQPIKQVCHFREPFFLIRMPEKITIVFPIRLKEESDVVLATAFFQELVDVGYSASCAKAPPCTWSPIPPPELRGEYLQYLNTNGGFVSFDIFSCHVKGVRMEKTLWILLNFYSYLNYYLKSTKACIQRKMRNRQEGLVKVLQKARIEEDEDNKQIQGPKSGRKLISFPKYKSFRRKCSAFARHVKRIRSPIKIKALNRFRRKWLKFPKCSSFKKYTKLE
ncbi:Actin-related protein 2/3 complex subunit 2B [Acorus gramineus]|uniref:Arp2/3 complex 34 kDa subunit n=1 Tax=Acorus gramineus TaxID=55184 RepID=A0AAV9A9N9_ACOGR|nr:Actin-related protein 2/3 complex subunit 2B [Acorus gramineus]